MIPDPPYCCYGLEYFCFEGDGVWNSPDADLIALATKELTQIGLAQPGDVVDGCVVRQVKAYAVYDDAYGDNVAIIREEPERGYPGLHLVFPLVQSVMLFDIRDQIFQTTLGGKPNESLKVQTKEGLPVGLAVQDLKQPGHVLVMAGV